MSGPDSPEPPGPPGQPAGPELPPQGAGLIAERAAEVTRWLRYAREDLRAAEAAAASEAFRPRHACLDAQQAAEKAIKAVLVSRSVPFPKVHDLDALRALIPDPASWAVTSPTLDLAPLTIWAVDARYPGEGPEPTEADATAAIATVMPMDAASDRPSCIGAKRAVTPAATSDSVQIIFDAAP